MVDLRSRYPGGFKAQPQREPAYNTENPRPAFCDEMRSYGFAANDHHALPSVPELGRVVRIKAPDDKPGKKSGWYYYAEFADDFLPGAYIGIGVFGSWKGNPERVVWTSKRRDAMSPSELARFEEKILAERIARENAIAEQHREAAEQAAAIWAAGQPPPAKHPYLVAKGIQAHDLLVDERGRLIVPMMDGQAQDKIASVQFIGTDGSKRFLTGGKTKGCYYPMLGEGDVIYIAEGFATAATLHEITASTVYVAFNAGNIMEVTSTARDRHPGAQIIICGDDDVGVIGNPGRSKAGAAADVLRCKAIFPVFGPEAKEGDTDFNDMARLYGRDAVRELLEAKPTVYQRQAAYDSMPEPLLTPPGVLGDIAAYYNATARAPQPGFAVQTALALASVVCGRSFRTTKGNHTSLYFLNVAKSGTGKEHAKTVIEDILAAANIDDIVNGSGYTSAGAVFSTLLRKPKHITIIDEFGRYLAASNAQKNSNLMEANTQLMEAIGRCHGVMRPVAYSTMTITKDKADELANRKISNPAITLLGMTTPAALYKNVDADNVADGFLGRFIIHQSRSPRMVHDDKDLVDVPHRIVEWIERIYRRSGQDIGGGGVSSDPPKFETIPFSGPALRELREFDEFRVELCNKLEQYGLEALPGRSKEMAMRLALIVALAVNPACFVIDDDHARWATDYIKFSLDQTIAAFKIQVSGSEYEANKKTILQGLRDAGPKGVTWREMQKTPPFSRFKSKELKEIIASLVDAELADIDKVPPGGRGRPREAYIALD